MNIVDGSPVGTSRCRGDDAGAATVPDRRIPDEQHAAVCPRIDNALLAHVSDHHVVKVDRGRGDNTDAIGSVRSWYCETVAGNAANFDGLRWIACHGSRQIDDEAAEGS